MEEVPEGAEQVFPSFTTAGGREIKVSDASINEAKKKLEAEAFDCDVDVLQKKPAAFPSFSTAGGREVKISDASINEAKRKLEAESDCDVDILQKKPAAFPSFSTAGGREVKISDASINEAKKKLEAEAFDCDVDVLQKKPGVFPSFSTAGGREVKISDTSIELAKKKLQDVTLDADIFQSMGAEGGATTTDVVVKKEDLLFSHDASVSITPDDMKEIAESTRAFLEDSLNDDEWNTGPIDDGVPRLRKRRHLDEYDEPPPLNPLPTSSKRGRVSRKFVTPRRVGP